MQPKSLGSGRLFFGAAWAAVVLGCSPTTPPLKIASPYQGAVVRVACPDDATAALIAVSAPAWANRCQAHVETTTYTLPKGLDSVADADVWVIRPAEMPRWAAAGRLVPAPKESTAAESGSGWTGLLPLYRDRLLLWDRIAYALPIRGEAPVCFYRSDLLGDAGRRAAYEAKYRRKLGPPRTWDEFADIAEFFQGEPAGLAHSLPPLPEDDGALEREFYAVAACCARRAVSGDESAGPERADEMFGFYYDLQTGRPRIDGPGFVKALALLRRLRKCRPEEASPSPADAFRGGQAVLCLADASRLTEFQNGEGTTVRDRFGICRTPAAACYFPTGGSECVPAPDGNYIPYVGSGAWIGVVPKDAPHAEAAFSLLAELSGREASDQMVIGARFGGDPIRSEQLEERTSWSGFELTPETVKELQEALQQTLLHRGVENPVLPLRTPDQGEHQVILAAALRTALTSPEDDPKKVLEQVARRWQEIDRAKGAAHLAEYRISVGLLPD